MKQRAFLLFVFSFAVHGYAPAQWYNDSPTPAEITTYDKPHVILQQQVKNKICNADWDISRGFFLLGNDPGNRNVIVRGAGIHHFSVSRYGNGISIQLKKESPLFKINADSIAAYTKIMQQDGAMKMQMLKALAANNYKITPAEKKSADSIKIIDDNASLKMTHFLNEKTLANISMDINMDWTDDLGFTGGYSVLNNTLHVAGADEATLYAELPGKDRIDTFYVADLYFGNWPQPPVKKALPFHFKYGTSYRWADKAHSGTPVIENMIVHIETYHYNYLLYVLGKINWTELDALVKK